MLEYVRFVARGVKHAAMKGMDYTGFRPLRVFIFGHYHPRERRRSRKPESQHSQYSPSHNPNTGNPVGRKLFDDNCFHPQPRYEEGDPRKSDRL